MNAQQRPPHVEVVVISAEWPTRRCDGDEIFNDAHGGGPRLYWLRQVAVPALLLAAVAAVVLVLRPWDKLATSAAARVPPAATRSLAPSATATPDAAEVQPYLITPTTLELGRPATVVGFRHSGLCGPTQLLLDGVAIDYRSAPAVPRYPGWDETFLMFDVPSTTQAGAHHLQLVGPVPGGGRNRLCDSYEHQDEIDAVDVVLIDS